MIHTKKQNTFLLSLNLIEFLWNVICFNKKNQINKNVQQIFFRLEVEP